MRLFLDGFLTEQSFQLTVCLLQDWIVGRGWSTKPLLDSFR